MCRVTQAGDSSEGLADSWIDFLIQQAEADAEAEKVYLPADGAPDSDHQQAPQLKATRAEPGPGAMPAPVETEITMPKETPEAEAESTQPLGAFRE